VSIVTDETLSAAPELETATPAAVEQTPETEPENLQLPAIEEGAEPEVPQQPEEDFEELEWSGKKFKAPKGLKDGVLMHADYTRKTQEVAEHRKALDAEKARIEQQAIATEQELDLRASLRTIDAEIKKFEAFGWAEYQQLRQTDPLSADEAWNYKSYLEAEKARATNALGEMQTTRTQQAQQDTAKRLEATLDFARKIPGMTQEVHEEVLKLAIDKGVPKERLAEVMDPTVYNILYHARLGYQVAAAKSAPQKPANAPAAPAPLQVVRGNAPAKKALADMDMEEYVAARRAGRKG
jgi:hypothetical protein